MKNIKFLQLAAAVLFGGLLSGCVADDIDTQGEDPANGTERFILSMNVSVNGSKTGRGVTGSDNSSTDGSVDGTDAENNILSIQGFICKQPTNGAAIEVISEPPTTFRDNGDGTWFVECDITADVPVILKEAGRKVSILMVANAAETNTNHNLGIVDDVKRRPWGAKFPITTISTAGLGDYAGAGNNEKGHTLFMSSYCDFELSVPGAQSDADDVRLTKFREIFSNPTGTSNNKNKYHAMNGLLQIEHGVARVEYQDKTGRPTDADNANLPKRAHTYFIGSSDVKIELQTLQIFNVNKGTIFVLRHTTDARLSKVDEAKRPFVLFGDEDGYNNDQYAWVPSGDWNVIEDLPEGHEDRDRFFLPKTRDFYNRLTVNENAKTYEIASDYPAIGVATLDARKVSDEDGYHPWCYITENTVPNITIMADKEQRNKTLTGVAYNFVLLNTKDEPLTYSETKANYPAGVNNPKSGDGLPSGSIIVTMPDGKWRALSPDSEGRYHLAYIAQIVHNNDVENYPNTLPPMYYGVVRNNTYQLMVEEVKGLPFSEEKVEQEIVVNVKVKQWGYQKFVTEW